MTKNFNILFEQYKFGRLSLKGLKDLGLSDATKDSIFSALNLDLNNDGKISFNKENNYAEIQNLINFWDTVKKYAQRTAADSDYVLDKSEAQKLCEDLFGSKVSVDDFVKFFNFTINNFELPVSAESKTNGDISLQYKNDKNPVSVKLEQARGKMINGVLDKNHNMSFQVEHLDEMISSLKTTSDVKTVSTVFRVWK